MKKVFAVVGTVMLAAVVFAVAFVVTLIFKAEPFEIIPQYYTAEHFNIETVKSLTDYDSDGIDDYTDFLLGARADAEAHPIYDSKYYEGGYPPDSIGVCTDVVWRSFRDTGYCLKDMVDNDIAAFPDDYPSAVPDPNIDFRRVRNLRVFFEKYAINLTTDINDISAWQPGDIVIFEDDEHIGIISDRRNKKGQAFVIHNTGQSKREQDYLSIRQVSGHYRFDASKIDENILIKWHD